MKVRSLKIGLMALLAIGGIIAPAYALSGGSNNFTADDAIPVGGRLDSMGPHGALFRDMASMNIINRNVFDPLANIRELLSNLEGLLMFDALGIKATQIEELSKAALDMLRNPELFLRDPKLFAATVDLLHNLSRDERVNPESRQAAEKNLNLLIETFKELPEEVKANFAKALEDAGITNEVLSKFMESVGVKKVGALASPEGPIDLDEPVSVSAGGRTFELPKGTKAAEGTEAGKPGTYILPDGTRITISDDGKITIGEGKNALTIEIPTGANKITIVPDGKGGFIITGLNIVGPDDEEPQVLFSITLNNGEITVTSGEIRIHIYGLVLSLGAGSTIKSENDNIIINIKGVDGTYAITTGPDGETIITLPNGKQITLPKGSNFTLNINPDGSVSIDVGNGTIITIDVKGETLTINQGENVIKIGLKGAQNIKISSKDDGSISILARSGSEPEDHTLFHLTLTADGKIKLEEAKEGKLTLIFNGKSITLSQGQTFGHNPYKTIQEWLDAIGNGWASVEDFLRWLRANPGLDLSNLGLTSEQLKHLAEILGGNRGNELLEAILGLNGGVKLINDILNNNAIESGLRNQIRVKVAEVLAGNDTLLQTIAKTEAGQSLLESIFGDDQISGEIKIGIAYGLLKYNFPLELFKSKEGKALLETVLKFLVKLSQAGNTFAQGALKEYLTTLLKNLGDYGGPEFLTELLDKWANSALQNKEMFNILSTILGAIKGLGEIGENFIKNFITTLSDPAKAVVLKILGENPANPGNPQPPEAPSKGPEGWRKTLDDPNATPQQRAEAARKLAEWLKDPKNRENPEYTKYKSALEAALPELLNLLGKSDLDLATKEALRQLVEELSKTDLGQQMLAEIFGNNNVTHEAKLALTKILASRSIGIEELLKTASGRALLEAMLRFLAGLYDNPEFGKEAQLYLDTFIQLLFKTPDGQAFLRGVVMHLAIEEVMKNNREVDPRLIGLVKAILSHAEGKGLLEQVIKDLNDSRSSEITTKAAKLLAGLMNFIKTQATGPGSTPPTDPKDPPKPSTAAEARNWLQNGTAEQKEAAARYFMENPNEATEADLSVIAKILGENPKLLAEYLKSQKGIELLLRMLNKLSGPELTTLAGKIRDILKGTEGQGIIATILGLANGELFFRTLFAQLWDKSSDILLDIAEALAKYFGINDFDGLGVMELEWKLLDLLNGKLSGYPVGSLKWIVALIKGLKAFGEKAAGPYHLRGWLERRFNEYPDLQGLIYLAAAITGNPLPLFPSQQTKIADWLKLLWAGTAPASGATTPNNTPPQGGVTAQGVNEAKGKLTSGTSEEKRQAAKTLAEAAKNPATDPGLRKDALKALSDALGKITDPGDLGVIMNELAGAITSILGEDNQDMFTFLKGDLGLSSLVSNLQGKLNNPKLAQAVAQALGKILGAMSKEQAKALGIDVQGIIEGLTSSAVNSTDLGLIQDCIDALGQMGNLGEVLEALNKIYNKIKDNASLNQAISNIVLALAKIGSIGAINMIDTIFSDLRSKGFDFFNSLIKNSESVWLEIVKALGKLAEQQSPLKDRIIGILNTIKLNATTDTEVGKEASRVITKLGK